MEWLAIGALTALGIFGLAGLAGAVMLIWFAFKTDSAPRAHPIPEWVLHRSPNPVAERVQAPYLCAAQLPHRIAQGQRDESE